MAWTALGLVVAIHPYNSAQDLFYPGRLWDLHHLINNRTQYLFSLWVHVHVWSAGIMQERFWHMQSELHLHVIVQTLSARHCYELCANMHIHYSITLSKHMGTDTHTQSLSPWGLKANMFRYQLWRMNHQLVFAVVWSQRFGPHACYSRRLGKTCIVTHTDTHT